MGTSQSADERQDSNANSGSHTKQMKTDYYDVLGVERTANEEDIKRAYKKKALELHPDRNINDVARATKLFTEVQAAYEVLSNAHERTWYDAHKQQILQDDDNAERPYENEGYVTTSIELLRKFSLFSSRMDFKDNNPKGFYNTASEIFQMLALEEENASNLVDEDIINYPSFGYAKSGYEDFVKPFYSTWTNFRTRKSFTWMDVYRYQDAPDRRIKRLMEKENKKLRESSIKEFNSTVQEFVLLVRKRDPRFLPNFQTEKERNDAAQAAAKSQSMRDRAANAAKLSMFEEADWTKTSTLDENLAISDDEEDEEIREEYECLVCDKIFKSEKSLDSHEKSKKHIRNVQLLRRRMEVENDTLGLGADSEREMSHKSVKDLDPDSSTEHLSSPADEDIDESATDEINIGDKETSIVAIDDAHSASMDQAKYNETSFAFKNLSVSDESLPKLGKAKAKRAKKAQRLAGPAESNVLQVVRVAIKSPGILPLTVHFQECIICKERFISRTKLFQHIKDEGHAMTANSLKANAAGKKRR